MAIAAIGFTDERHGDAGVVRNPVPSRSGDDHAACSRERCDEPDRRFGPELVRCEAGDQRAGDKAEVAPEAVDADGASAIDWLDCVGDRSDQGR